MAHTLTTHRFFVNFGRIVEHAAFIVAGFVLMVIGLALGVTIIMLPVGLVVGFAGLLMVIGGIFARIDQS